MALEPIAEEINKLLEKAGGSSPTYDPKTYLQRRIDDANSRQGKLEGYDCPKCLNRGYSLVLRDGREWAQECDCMTIRRNMRRVERSGLADAMERYSFDSWKEEEPWQAKALALARSYAKDKDGWLVAYGRPGSGKTHLCTAICGELMQEGIDVRYIRWRDFSTKAKALVNREEDYSWHVEPVKKVKCLYVDDFFKSGATAPTAADVNLAYEIIGARYDDARKMTIISTEYSVDDLLNIDEAVGSRILERSRGHVMSFEGKGNWRLK